MSTFTTRCPHCHAMNRLPHERVNDNSVCGACKKSLLEGKPVEGTSQNLPAFLNSDKPVVIDFWAPWCNPCVGFSPVFNDVAQERCGELHFVKVDTEAQQSLATEYRIRSIPTLMVFKGGKLVDTLNGALPKSQFNQWLTQALEK